MIRSYLNYWWRLAFAHLSNWGLSHLLIPPQCLGFIHASLDQAFGKTKVYYSGLKAIWVDQAANVLRDVYQIEYVNWSSPYHPEWHATYEHAYNLVAKKAIRQKFGMDVVELCLVQAEYQSRQNQVQNVA